MRSPAPKPPQSPQFPSAPRSALLPPWLDKSHAVAYVKHKLEQRHPGVVTFGMGDSLVDLAFMNECQYLIVPAASQIAQLRMGAL